MARGTERHLSSALTPRLDVRNHTCGHHRDLSQGSGRGLRLRTVSATAPASVSLGASLREHALGIKVSFPGERGGGNQEQKPHTSMARTQGGSAAGASAEDPAPRRGSDARFPRDALRRRSPPSPWAQRSAFSSPPPEVTETPSTPQTLERDGDEPETSGPLETRVWALTGSLRSEERMPACSRSRECYASLSDGKELDADLASSRLSVRYIKASFLNHA